MARAIIAAIVTGLAAVTSLPGANIRGTVTIERKLTPRNVTPAAGLYQRGTTVALRPDASENALDFERSHVVVYLDGQQSVPSSTATAAMEQQNRRFSPDLVVIPAGSAVSFPNFDPIFHNVFSLSKPKSFDLGNYPKGQTRTVTFPKPGIVSVYCHLHPNMAGTIVVTPNQWGARADAAGQFVLADVPPGKYTVVAWHKTGGTFRKTIDVVAGQDSEVNFFVPLPELSGGDADRHDVDHHAGR
ncbi:MAG TPA: carboxypeptidase regulatory-like domain-containing protein [Bryobacteraceae bacterium]|jgi:plastocyanin|nr:carboxypeptidase regulatory-like domain-containing protein [Bryobacteraceae bacterium]